MLMINTLDYYQKKKKKPYAKLTKLFSLNNMDDRQTKTSHYSSKVDQKILRDGPNIHLRVCS